MRFLPTMSLFVSMSILAACGGGTTVSNALTATGPITIANLNEAGEALFDSPFSSDPSFSNAEDVADLSATGSASYAGFMFAEQKNSSETLVGRTRINANFADGGSLTGSVTDLVLFPNSVTEIEDAQDEGVFEPIPADTEFVAIVGSLALSDGSIEAFPGGAGIRIDVAGDMTIPAGSLEAKVAEVLAVSGKMIAIVTNTGDFLAAGELAATGPNLEALLDTIIIAK